jgi:opacity protein-like surface antigen
MRKSVTVVLTLLLTGLFATVAAAQVPTAGNVYFGYTYYNTDLSLNRGSLNGWQATLEGKLLPFLGVVADITGHYGSLSFPAACPVGVVPCSTSISLNAHVYESMFGPRIGVPIGKFRPFGEFEIGVGHVSTNGAGSDTSFATAVGGGLDYKIFKPLAWRFQGDYIHTSFFSNGQNNLRLSTGIVLRF